VPNFGWVWKSRISVWLRGGTNRLKQVAPNSKPSERRGRNSVNLEIQSEIQSDFTVKSAFSGKLFDVLRWKEGTLITPTPCNNWSRKFILLELEVDEMTWFENRTKVLVTMDGYKDSLMLSLLSTIMNERSRTFKIEAHFVSHRKTLPKSYSQLSSFRLNRNTISIPKHII
jgi:hypothetical protein